MEKVFMLPSKEEIMKRLNSLNYDSHLTERFYPLIARNEFQPVNTFGINMIISLALEDYCKEMDTSVKAVMIMLIPQFIDKLIDDDEIKKEALKNIRFNC